MEIEHLPPLEHSTDLGPTERSGARDVLAPRNPMGENVTIQKNWQELIRPGKLQVTTGADARRIATLFLDPLDAARISPPELSKEFVRGVNLGQWRARPLWILFVDDLFVQHEQR